MIFVLYHEVIKVENVYHLGIIHCSNDKTFTKILEAARFATLYGCGCSLMNRSLLRKKYIYYRTVLNNTKGVVNS